MGRTRGPIDAAAVLVAALCPAAAAAADGRPVVAVALDTSASLAGSDVANGRALAAALLGTLPPGSEVMAFTFDDRVHLAVARTSDAGQVRLGLAAALPRGRHTALHDALYDAARALHDSGPRPRAILLLTDGRDDQSALLLEDGLRLALEERIPVHAVGLGRRPLAKALRRIAKLTGGSYLPAAEASPEQVGAHVAASLAAGVSGRGLSPATGGAGTPPHTRDVATGFLLLLLAAVIAALALGRGRAAVPAPPLAARLPRAARLPVPPRALLPAQALSPAVVARLESATQEYLEDTARLEERPVLCVLRGPEAGQVFELSAAGTTSVGRARANDVRLHDLAVSAEHCRIQPEDGRFVLQDLRSRNGTYVNERRVGRHVLAPGDLITVGETQAAFRTGLRPGGAEATPGPSPAGPSART